LSVTLRKAGITKNVDINWGINSVSNIYPSGIQLRKRNKVSKVTLIRLVFCELAIIKLQSVNTCWNSLFMDSFRFFALVWVIWPLEKSKTSSLQKVIENNLLKVRKESLIFLKWNITWVTLRSPCYFDTLFRLFY
jgi:hypothetical protein